jgi:hypothetical protein
MPAIVAAAADAIQREIEVSTLRVSIDLQVAAARRKACRCSSTPRRRKWRRASEPTLPRCAPYITDFVSCGASIYDAHHTMDAVKRASHLGLSGIEVHSVDLGGASIPAALEIARRLCESEPRAVLIAGSEVPRSLTASSRYYREVNDALLHKELELHTQANLISLYALFADRLMFEHGLTQAQVDAITTFYRNQAQANPRAATCGKPLSARASCKALSRRPLRDPDGCRRHRPCGGYSGRQRCPSAADLKKELAAEARRRTPLHRRRRLKLHRQVRLAAA